MTSGRSGHWAPRWAKAVAMASAVSWVVLAGTAQAETRYVSPDSPSPMPPYLNWSSAAHSIQEALDASEAGDVVRVTNGVYQSGSRLALGPLPNRVVVPHGVTLQSLHGPELTRILGAAPPDGTLGPGSVRCVFLHPGAKLEGFTLAAGHTLDDEAPEAGAGGGLFAVAQTDGWAPATAVNCVLAGNVARTGGGAHGGVLRGCRLEGNRAGDGGGAANATLIHCRVLRNEASGWGGGLAATLEYVGSERRDHGFATACVLAGNRARDGGGAAGGVRLVHCTVTGNTASVQCGGVNAYATVFNGIVAHNRAPTHPNHVPHDNGLLTFSCSQPLHPGPGNLDVDPRLVSATHLDPASPCRAAGSRAYLPTEVGTDLDGDRWADPPPMGADQPASGAASGPLRVALEANPPEVVAGRTVALYGQIEGRATRTVWDFGDGQTRTNDLYAPWVQHAWPVPGTWRVRCTSYNEDHPTGVSATVEVRVLSGQTYVDAASPSPRAPYTTWATAARTIDEAIQVALPGGVVWVTNGVYASGGRQLGFDAPTRVVVDKALTVRSVNGPAVTKIQGGPGTRCAFVGNEAVLDGFTLTGARDVLGGGAYGQAGGTLTRCVVVDNHGPGVGGVYGARVTNCRIERNRGDTAGGLLRSTVFNSLIAENVAVETGGASECDLTHCTVVLNRAERTSGGTSYSRLTNSIVYHNECPASPNHAQSEGSFTCTTPLLPGAGNLDVAPGLASALRPAPDSPLRQAGNAAFSSGVDLDGRPWATPPSLGAIQSDPGPRRGPIIIEIVPSASRVFATMPVTFRLRIEGQVARHRWDLGDGAGPENQPLVNRVWTSHGRHPIRVTAYNDEHPEGVVAALAYEVLAPGVTYVHALNPRPAYPFATWDTAATTIQDAVDACPSGQQVRVTNGVYRSGGRQVAGIWNRVVVDRPLRVVGIHGPASTILEGDGSDGRGVSLGENAVLDGLQVRGFNLRGSGGGILGAGSAVITNSWIIGNEAYDRGGALGGTYLRCRFERNRGGGVGHATLLDCVLDGNTATLGGGAYACDLRRCLLTGNVAAELRSGNGGGAAKGSLVNCVVVGNQAGLVGGGVFDARLEHCTVVGNTANGHPVLGGARGGGVFGGSIRNSILLFNAATGNPAEANHAAPADVAFSCTTPLPIGGPGNIDADPLFADRATGDFRLLPGSPAIDAGTVSSPRIPEDFASVPRPLDGLGHGTPAPDMGAFEVLRPSADSNRDGIPDGWTWDHGLDPTSLDVAASDPDGDGATSFQEWVAGTHPTDPESALRLRWIRGAGTWVVAFPGAAGHRYLLQTSPTATPGDWVPVGEAVGPGGDPATVSIPLPEPAHAAGYYRIRVLSP